MITPEKEYTFDKLKEKYTSSSQINNFNEDGNTVFTLFLEYYYKKLDTLSIQEKNNILKEDVLDRIDIKDIVEYFFKNHVDVNGFEEINENSKPPLAVAVKNADYNMVKLLLTNNACPNLFTKKVVFNNNVFYTNRLLEFVNKQLEKDETIALKEIKKILLHFGAHEEI